MELIHKDVTEKIIKSAYEVHNALGYGFLDKVYENALCISLAEAGFNIKQQSSITVTYKDQIVGEYIADILVDDKVIIEVKAVSQIMPVHEVQLVNYLKATGLHVGLLLNFAESMKLKRVVMTI